MASLNAPCKGCTKRYSKCHNDCTEYKDYTVKAKEISRLRQQDSYYFTYNKPVSRRKKRNAEDRKYPYM